MLKRPNILKTEKYSEMLQDNVEEDAMAVRS